MPQLQVHFEHVRCAFCGELADARKARRDTILSRVWIEQEDERDDSN